MAHCLIEYSANLETEVDFSAFCEVMRAAMEDHGAFPVPGIKVRAYPAHHYAIADGGNQHAFIDMHVRLREGRTDDVKKDATQHLFAAAKEFLRPTTAKRSLGLSLEMRDITAELAPKTGTIRNYLS